MAKKITIFFAILFLSSMAKSQLRYTIIHDTITEGLIYDVNWLWNMTLVNENELASSFFGYVDTNSTNNIFTGLSKWDIHTKKNVFNTITYDSLYNTGSKGPQSLLNEDLDSSIIQVGFRAWVDTTIVTSQYQRKQPMIRKFSKDGTLIWSRNWRDTTVAINLQSIKKSNHSYIVCGVISPTIYPTDPKQFYLCKLDTTGNVLWEKSYPAVPVEYLVNMAVDDDNNIYLNGLRQIPPYYEDNYHLLIKKVDSNGNLILNTYLPYKKNSSPSTLNIVKDVSNATMLVLINAENAENGWQVSTNNYDDIRLRILDSNLTIKKTVIKHLNLPILLQNVKPIKDNKFLIVGCKYEDSVDQDLGAWACIIDTVGNIDWEYTYDVRTHADHYITDGLQTPDGGYLLCGTVTGTSASNNQDGIILKIDSVGCLDSAGCWPFSISQYANEPISQFSVFPNPVDDILKIKLYTNEKVNTQVEVIDILGRKMAAFKSAKKEIEIETSKWTKGIYLVLIKQNNKTYSKKIIKN